jgi:hypothetical protein
MGRGLGGLAAGVGIHLGIEHQDVDVVGQGQDVVEAAVADVVGPAVAADDPDRAADQPFGDAGEFLGARVARGGQLVQQAATRRRCSYNPASSRWSALTKASARSPPRSLAISRTSCFA